ncbi:hypothetical protein MAPG_10202 [Magnaporthiopsis poae ATCC 64411]|uniref:BZIP domain-containing protein n=1 Tax=Magnaporthiopsis poae (strain ATCC 64411 / 73-15) TaxID=644358 RepID=A0A0C4EBZ0_MAGP6|nr:hypothetical protein MAPG_10202 [Magnaporthiopsis poae ATCC 64411]
MTMRENRDGGTTNKLSTAVRIRNNQRRSRARHRELVDELKARVREYELQGVQATLEMRQAARKVALENSQLRALLASRGVTCEEVEQYLASSNHRAAAAAAEAGGLSTAASAPSLPARRAALEPDAYLDPSPNQAPSTSALDMPAVAADAGIGQTCCGPTTQCSAVEAPPADVPKHVAAPSDSCSLGRGPALPSPTASHLEMTCTAAAHIMAGMYRDGNKELAREALGCSGPEECLVKNTLVFQLLDGAETGW